MVTTREVISELRHRNYNAMPFQNKTNNGIRNGIIIRDSDFQIDPWFNSDDIIMSAPLKSVDEIADMILVMYKQHCIIDADINRDFILENIHVVLQKKSVKPGTKVESIFKGVESCLCIYSSLGGDNQVFLSITDTLLKDNKISVVDAWQTAWNNNRRDAEIIPLSNIPDFELKANIQFPIYVATNKARFYGAATVLDKDFLEQSLSGEPYDTWQAVLSSIHRAILIPRCGDYSLDATSFIVRYLEKSDSMRTGRLTDTLYTVKF